MYPHFAVAVTPRGIIAVKNLGWLMDHLSKDRVSSVNVMAQERTEIGDPSAVLTVAFANGDLFQCDFASYKICLQFVARRHALKGAAVRHDRLPLVLESQIADWHETMIIDSGDWIDSTLADDLSLLSRAELRLYADYIRRNPSPDCARLGKE